MELMEDETTGLSGWTLGVVHPEAKTKVTRTAARRSARLALSVNALCFNGYRLRLDSCLRAQFRAPLTQLPGVRLPEG